MVISAAGAMPEAEGAERKILIVDDDDEFTEGLDLLLTVEGYAVQCASSIADAIDALDRFDADLILIDLHLGRESGIDLIDQLQERQPSINCVLMTAYADIEAVISTLRHGAQDFLTKPIHTDILLNVLDRCFEKRELEQAKTAAEEALSISEAHYRAVTDSAKDAIITIDKQGEIISWNVGAETIFGYTKDEVVGKSAKMLMPVESRADHSAGVKRVAAGGEHHLIGSTRELQGLRKSGDEFPLELSLANWVVDDEPFFSAIIRDITDRRATEEQLLQAQRMEAIGQLTGGVAHDFNNLLAIMIGNAQFLEDRAGEDEVSKEFIGEIKAAIDRGASLTGRLMAFSRKATLIPVAADVSDLIGSLHDMLRRTLGETVEIKIIITPELWPAMIDPHQFENALVNLAINARDAMPTGGTLTIETANVTLDKTYAEQHEEVTPGDYVSVAVSDTGTGMTPEVLEKVFEPFFTTKEVGQGSGLGLSMVYGFVKQSKGHITIYSEVDHGTTVKLYMPRSQEGGAKTVAEDDAVEPARGSERILVVEDDPRVRKGPVKILRDHGYEVVEAGNGEEAIDHLKSGQAFSLLFTDVVLPGGMNGVEIAKEAKRLQPSIKVLYTTGYAENAVVHNGQLEPGVTLVNKPFRREELLKKVRAMLDSEDT